LGSQYEWSAARPTREELALVVGQRVPPPPSAAASDVQTARLLRGDLDAIVQFAMHKEPGMRYATVADLAADIRRHLEGKPVIARHPTLRYRAKCLVKRNGSRLVAAAVVVILLAGVLFAVWTRSQQIAREASMRAWPVPDSRKSIAVLPFESLGDNTTQPYFADGVQDDILTDLGKVRDLKVISRSGVAAYREKKRNVKQIGRDLGVASVLEGSLQISGDRVRINAQLIDTQTDAQIWRNSTIENWRTSSRYRANSRRRSRANSKQLSPTVKRRRFGDNRRRICKPMTFIFARAPHCVLEAESFRERIGM